MGFLKRITFLIMILCVSSSCFAQGEETMEYERNSMHVMMLKHMNYKFGDVLEHVFLEIPFPQRFNDHNLGVKVATFAESEGDQSANIASFIQQVNLGQKMVAKWFDRNKQSGSFDMELVKKRGYYNATESQKNVARTSLRGLALLEDAGENLIDKTYLLVNDISYKSKGSGNWVLKFIGQAYTHNIDDAQKSMQAIGGFKVHITSYLFHLKWNDDIANKFYNDYYTENGPKNPDKVNGFKNEHQLFEMEYVGKTESESVERNFRAVKDPKSLLVKITTQTMDQNIAQLQHQYADFRIKAPLLSVNPLKADVGLKEDITEASRFEVLERNIDDKGRVSYERIGVIKPVKGKIKDNRYMETSDESPAAALDATEFEVVSGHDFFPGMLIREM